MKLKPRRIFNFLILITTAIMVTACSGEQSNEFMNWMVWMGNHPTLLTVILVTVVVPGVAMIPGVGIPVSAVIAKVGMVLIPLLKEVAKAVENDEQTNPLDRSRSVGEAAGTIVGKLAGNRDSLIGRIPGTGLAANIAAAAVVRKVRRHKKKFGVKAFPNF